MRLIASIFALGLAVPAYTQVEFGFGGDSPISVKAETATYIGGLTVLETDVVVSQDDTTVTADRMDIYREEPVNGKSSPTVAGSISIGALKRIEAEGRFRFENPENIVTGERGTYYADRKIFIVSGNVELVQTGGTSVRGDRLVYDTVKDTARFGTPCETGTAPEGECGNGRVTIRIE